MALALLGAARMAMHQRALGIVVITLGILPGCGARSELEFPSCARAERSIVPFAAKDVRTLEFSGTAIPPDGDTLVGGACFGLCYGEMGAVGAGANGDIFVAGGLGPGSIDFGGGVHEVASPSAFVAKFDASGQYQWDRLYPVPAIVQELAVDPEGNLLVAGPVIGPVDFAGHPRRNGDSTFFAKLNPAGDILWTKVWAAFAEARTFPFDFDGCGRVFLTGTSDDQSGPALGVDGNGLFVAAYNPAGDALWSRTYGGSLGDTEPSSIAVDNEGNIVLLGSVIDGVLCYDPTSGNWEPCAQCLSEPGGTPIPCAPADFGGAPPFSPFLVKLTRTGDPVWQEAATMEELSSPTLGGVDAFDAIFVYEGVPRGDLQRDPWDARVHRLGASGQLISTTPVPVDGASEAFDVAVGPSGHLLAAGRAKGAATGDPAGNWIVELDGAGKPTWSLAQPSDEVHVTAALGFDAAGRPLATGMVLRQGAPSTLFLTFVPRDRS